MTQHPTEDPMLFSLKKRYFDVLAKENFPQTPSLTSEANALENMIRQLQEKDSQVAQAT